MNKEIQIASAIIESIRDGIYVVNQDYILEFMNPAMIEVFGEGVGKKCHRIINHSDRICPWCRAQEVFSGKTMQGEVYIPIVDKTYDIADLPMKNQDGTVSKLSICRDVTWGKQREEKLKAYEEDYNSLFEHVACGVFVSSKEGKFLDANQALLDILGYESKAEFLNIDIARDLYVNTHDRKKFREMIERDGRVVDYEVEFKRKDGSTLPLLLTGHVRYDRNGEVVGYEGLNVDISQRKLMEKEIKEAYDFINKIIQSSPNPTIANDMAGKIMIWNLAAEENLGYPAEDVIGKMDVRKIYPDGMAKKVMAMMRGPGYGGVGKLRAYPMVFLRQDGSPVEGALSAAILYDAEGKEFAVVGSFVDLEEKMEMDRTLRRTQEQLLQAEKLAAMGRLTSQIAHELNNPLYGIMNTLELLKTEISPQSRRRKILEMALSETVRLSELLSKMLSFSKPDQAEKQAVGINTLLDEIVMLHEKQLQENNIKISTAFGEELPKIYASKNQLRQVFINLLLNALAAMPDGGTLSVTTRAAGGKVEIDIADTGVGIKKAHLNKIFDSFFTTKDGVKGVGLGLSVCYGFIKEHDGDIQVKSTPGQGATFTITIPEYNDGE